MKDKLYAEVWQRGGYDSEMGHTLPYVRGKVVRQTAKSIWIEKWNDTIEKWNLQPNGRWRCPSRFGHIEHDFDFKLDPLIRFIYSKENAE